MRPLGLTDEEVRCMLGAARALAGVDGKIEEHERVFIESAARALDAPRALETIEPVTPDEAAAGLKDPVARERLVQGLLVLAVIDGDVDSRELSAIKRYAKALGVEEPRIEALKKLSDGHIMRVRWDLIRRSAMLRNMVSQAWDAKGPKGIWQFFGGLKGYATDAQKAMRYQELALLPAGTFGRAYWQHMTERQFAFPGEPNGFPDEMVVHDLAHVLGDYDTDARSECEVVGFISGFMKHDPFGYLFMIVMHMQVEVPIFDGTPTERMIIPIERVATAMERGRKVKRDLYDPSWDYWAEFPRPLDDVRRTLGIAPRA